MTRLSFTHQVNLAQAGQDLTLTGTGCVTKKNSPYQRFFDSKTNYKMGNGAAIRNWRVSQATYDAAASIADLSDPLTVWLLLVTGQSSIANFAPIKISASQVFRLFAAANNIAVGEHLSEGALRKRVQYYTKHTSIIDIVFNSKISHMFTIGKIQGKNVSEIFIQAKDHNCIVEKFATEAVLENKHKVACFPVSLWTKISTTNYSKSSEPNKEIKSVIAEYMSTVGKKHYKFNATKRDAGRKFVQEYYLDKSKHSYNHEFGQRMLEQIETLYKIDKAPVEINHYTGKHNERSFGKGLNLQFMKKELRQILYPDWYDGDMVNCHLAIINELCGLGLDLSVSIWETIETKLHEIGPDSSWWVALPSELKEKNSAVLKSMFKVAVYSIIYGSTFKNVVAGAAKLLHDVCGYVAGPEFKQMFEEHGLIEFLYKNITNYKRFNQMKNKDFSLRCQEIEASLISEVYKVAQQYSHDEIVVTVHSHDGVTFKAASLALKEEFTEKCAAAIAKAAAKESITMAWVVKSAPTHVVLGSLKPDSIVLCDFANLHTVLASPQNHLSSVPTVRANIATIRTILLWRF